MEPTVGCHGIVDRDDSDDFREQMRKQIETRPRLKFVCERDWYWGPHWFAIGLCWSRNFEAEPGEHVYRRRMILRFRAPEFRFEKW
jgi:hypothetical protein